MMSSSEKNGKNLEYLSMEESQEVMVKGMSFERGRGKKPPNSGGDGATWLKKRSTLEKCLLFVLLILVVVCIILLICLIVAAASSNKADEVATEEPTKGSPSGSIKGVCVTPECVMAAGTTLASMDTTVEPCDDFYQYACGGWTQNNFIPDGEPKYTVLDQLRNHLMDISRALLEGKNTNVSETVLKAKNFYASCINEDLIDEYGARPLLDLIDDLGGWPVISGDFWDEDGWDLSEVLAKIRMEMDYNFLFMHNINPDLNNREVNIIVLDQPMLVHKQKSFYLNEKTDSKLAVYQKYMVDIVMTLRPDHDIVEAEDEMQDVLAFECALANFSLSQAERRDLSKMNNRYTLEKLETNMPQIEWSKYFNLIHKDQVLPDEEIINYNPDFFEKMAAHIQKTPKRTIANYLMWRILVYMIDYMGKDFRAIRQPFLAVTEGKKSEGARWKVCFDNTNHLFSMAMGALFVQKHFDEESKARAKEMVNDIRKTLIETIQDVEWMDEETKTKALTKASKIQEQIGYDEILKDEEAINNEYKTLEMYPEFYFNNVRAVWKDDATKALSKLGKPVQPDVWKRTPIEVNAFYMITINTIRFPAGIFQAPFYSKLFPEAMNYGGIGMVIGHELMHGFDDKGSLFDDDGLFNNWFSNSSREAYNDRMQCFIDQYSGYYVPEVDLYVNGESTQGETLADNGGIKEAYLAYKLWESRNGDPGDTLPGINLNHDQLFFVNYAQLWCSLHSNENMELMIQTDFHPPERFRVIGTLSNSKYFAKAFQCKKGSRMVRDEPCQLW